MSFESVRRRIGTKYINLKSTDFTKIEKRARLRTAYESI